MQCIQPAAVIAWSRTTWSIYEQIIVFLMPFKETNPMIVLNNQNQENRIIFVFRIVSSSVFLIFGLWTPDLAFVDRKFEFYTKKHP